MDRKTMRRLLLEGLLAMTLLVIPFFLLFLGSFVVPALLSAWATTLIIVRNMQKQNPAINEKTGFQLVEKFLYFQAVNMAFAFGLIIELMTLLAIGIVVTLVVLLLKARKNPSEKLRKWSKYIALHVFNLVVLVVLMNTFTEVQIEVLVFVLPIITFINGLQAAFYIRLEQNLRRRMHKRIAVIIILAMIVSTAWQMFPN